ncbi:MAG: type II toxin-antitoxin system tRNA(fMet)-specific endonuclease VapC [Thermoanaerobaculia bacterium]
MKYLLDTNVCLDYLTRRFPRVIDRIQEASPEELATSSVVAAELRYGADKSRHPARNHARLDVLLGEIRCLDFDLAAARSYGQLRAALERRGRPIGAHDMLIAAHAMAAGLVLVTDNVREFGRVPRLSCENWRR